MNFMIIDLTAWVRLSREELAFLANGVRHASYGCCITILAHREVMTQIKLILRWGPRLNLEGRYCPGPIDFLEEVPE